MKSPSLREASVALAALTACAPSPEESANVEIGKVTRQLTSEILALLDEMDGPFCETEEVSWMPEGVIVKCDAHNELPRRTYRVDTSRGIAYFGKREGYSGQEVMEAVTQSVHERFDHCGEINNVYMRVPGNDGLTTSISCGQRGFPSDCEKPVVCTSTKKNSKSYSEPQKIFEATFPIEDRFGLRGFDTHARDFNTTVKHALTTIRRKTEAKTGRTGK